MGTDCGRSVGSALPAQGPALTLEKRSAWCAEAERNLAKTFGNDREAIIARVNAGTMELWKINGGQAWMVTRAAFGVLTVCCLEGSGLAGIAPAIMRIAISNGMEAVEFWTRRPGLARLLRAFNLEQLETGYRCRVPHER